MSELMVSVAGIRGIVGDSLTPDVIMEYISAFSEFCGEGVIVVGRDSRPSGKQISDIVCATLNMCGHDVIDLGISTTPTIEMGVQLYEASGGIAITASHNPIEWNAMKFFNSDTLFLDQEQGIELQGILKSRLFKYVTHDKVGQTTQKFEEAKNYHIRKVLDIPFINKSDIRKRNFKVALDCVNGAGSVILPDILVDLGCSVTKLYCEPSGDFPHGAEPLPENLTEICKVIKEGNYDIGMVVDPDSDRLALISDAGEPLGEEYTLAMIADLILSKEKSDIAVNVSTTRAMDDVAARYGVKVYRTKVGEINVTQKMLKEGCTFGGEGNGGVILPAVHPGRDAVIGAALILQYLLEKDDFVTNIHAALPQYHILKDKTSIDGLDYDSIITEILSEEEESAIDTTDGVKINKEDYWVQLRKSNTEPIVRLFVEAATKEKAAEIMEIYKAKIK